jgi:hypothetical protein
MYRIGSDGKSNHNDCTPLPPYLSPMDGTHPFPETCSFLEYEMVEKSGNLVSLYNRSCLLVFFIIFIKSDFL